MIVNFMYNFIYRCNVCHIVIYSFLYIGWNVNPLLNVTYWIYHLHSYSHWHFQLLCLAWRWQIQNMQRGKSQLMALTWALKDGERKKCGRHSTNQRKSNHILIVMMIYWYKKIKVLLTLSTKREREREGLATIVKMKMFCFCSILHATQTIQKKIKFEQKKIYPIQT